MDSNTLFIIAIVVLYVATLAQAYNMGWQNGHDIHHDDETHGPSNPPSPLPYV